MRVGQLVLLRQRFDRFVLGDGEPPQASLVTPHMRAASLTTWTMAAAFVFSIFVPGAMAGEGDSQNAKRLATLKHDLTSDKSATVAHAAYSAGEEQRTSLVPELIETLTKRPNPDDREGWLVLKHLLDALIRLNAKVPIEVLERYEDHIQTSVLILAARNGKAAHPLLRRTVTGNMKEKDIKIAGVAAGNLLAAAQDPALAILFLSLIQPSVSVDVVDHDRPVGGGVISAVNHACGWCNVLEGFPPYVWYELSFWDRKRWGSTLLAKGAVQSVWVQRWTNSRKRFILGHSNLKREVTNVGLGWAATLLSTSLKQLALKKRYYGRHQWNDAEAYIAFIKDKRREVGQDAGALLEGLLKAGLLTEESRRKVAIEPLFKIKDDRDDKSVALPVIPGLLARKVW